MAFVLFIVQYFFFNQMISQNQAFHLVPLECKFTMVCGSVQFQLRTTFYFRNVIPIKSFGPKVKSKRIPSLYITIHQNLILAICHKEGWCFERFYGTPQSLPSLESSTWQGWFHPDGKTGGREEWRLATASPLEGWPRVSFCDSRPSTESIQITDFSKLLWWGILFSAFPPFDRWLKMKNKKGEFFIMENKLKFKIEELNRRFRARGFPKEAIWRACSWRVKKKLKN